MKKFFCICLLAISLQLKAVDVCFIATQTDSAEYFMQLARILDEKNISWEILASDDAEVFFKKHKVSFKKLSVWLPKKKIQELSYEDVVAVAKVAAKECKKAKIVVTETGETLIPRFHYELALISAAHRWVFHPSTSQISHLDDEALAKLSKTHPEGYITTSISESKFFSENDRLTDKEFFDRITDLVKGNSEKEIKSKILS